MPLAAVTNNTTILQGYLDVYGNIVNILPGDTKLIEQDADLPEALTKLTVIVDDDGAGTIEYIGYALPGTAYSSNGWAIKKRVQKDTDEEVYLWVDGDLEPKMIYAWIARATYTYA